MSFMVIPERQFWIVRRRCLRWPTAILTATVAVAAFTKNAGWFNVGGWIISAYGAYLWAHRVFRLKARADDPLPPVVLESYRTTGFVPVNPEHFNESAQRQFDNVKGIMGVWISIAGSFIASVLPFTVGLAHVWTR
jgi:hypothetical protein